LAKFKFHIVRISSVSAGQGKKNNKPQTKYSFQIQPNIHVNQKKKLPLASSGLEYWDRAGNCSSLGPFLLTHLSLRPLQFLHSKAKI